MKILPVNLSTPKINTNPQFCGKIQAAKNITNNIAGKFEELAVFHHHIYEYKKGIRSMILTTERACNKNYIIEKLESNKIPYLIHDVSENKINVFFGKKECIDVISTFDKHLNKLSPEQDFIVGILLGYDKLVQCKRYLKNISKKIITG